MTRGPQGARRQALAAWCAEQGVSAAVVTDSANVFYLTGQRYSTMERLLALAVDTRGNAILLLPEMERGRLEDSGVEELPYADGEDAMGRLLARLRRDQPVAVEKSHIRLAHAETLCRGLGGDFGRLRDCGGQLAAMRMIKDEAEIAALREACAATDQLLAEWIGQLREGVPESRLQLELQQIAAERGGFRLCPGTIIASGLNSSASHGLHHPKSLAKGEGLFIDFGVELRGYNSDITRTLFLGEPSSELRRLYDVVYEAQTAAVATVRPGLPIAEIDRVARGVIERAGLGQYFPHRTGHGLGIDIHEPPSAQETDETVLRPGMVFTVEPGVYLPGRAGIRIEDDVLVTGEGGCTLTNAPKRLEDVILQC